VQGPDQEFLGFWVAHERGIVLLMLVLAHRGANRLAPENTLLAFARALETGADGVELDVQRTRDDALVVRHDAHLPDGMLLQDVALSAARRVVPALATLEEALDVCAGSLVNIEIKHPPGDSWDRPDPAADLVVELLARRGGHDDVVVSSFNLAVIDRIRTLAPRCPTGWLTYAQDPLEAVATVVDHRHSALHPHVASVAGLTAEEVVRLGHTEGVQINVWTVNDAAELRRLAAAGVDAVVSDVPDRALRALGR
jgi:glycerophosphoryl diester phosphodiesterase